MPATVSTPARRDPRQSDLPSQTYSLADVAALFGVGYSSAWEHVRRGDFPVIPIRVGNQFRFPKAIVDRMLGLEPESDD